MFGRTREALRNTDEDRAYLRERYAALAAAFERRAFWEAFVLEAPDLGPIRRLHRLLRLRLWRRGVRVARASMERLRGSEG